MQEIVDNSDIFTVDAHYVQDELASIHLVRSNERIAIIDTGTQHSIPEVKAALDSIGLGFDSVDFVVLTHIHLDHAGGAGALMALCENAVLVVHERGARHMADPSKLVAGATAVYGEEEFSRLYGKIPGIDQQRILVPKEGETLEVGGRPLTFIDSPGHASHHHCIIDEQTNSVFTGDTLGVGYRALRRDDRAFLMPTTTPVQFDPAALHNSIDKVMKYAPDWLYLTHYSAIKPTDRMIVGLHEQIDDFVRLAEEHAQPSDADFLASLNDALLEYLVQRCISEIPEISPTLANQWIKLDADLDAQGLVFWWNHRRNR